MTVNSTVSRVDFTGNGSTATYPFSFAVQKKEDLTIIETNTSGVETTLALDVGYTVTLNTDGTGSVTLTAGNLTNLHKLSILRELELTQTTDFRDQGTFSGEYHENTHDRTVQQIQQVNESVSRSIRNSKSEKIQSFLKSI